jgi:hypothetical protein
MSMFARRLLLLFWALVLTVSVHAAQVKLAPGDGIWLKPVYNGVNHVLGKEAAVIADLETRSLKHIFLWTTKFNSSDYANYSTFIQLAHNKGMTVHGVCAVRSSIEVDDELSPALLSNYLNEVVSYNDSNPSARLDGVQIDIEGVPGEKLLALASAVTVPETLVFSAAVQPNEFFTSIESFYARLLQETDLDLLMPMLYIMDGIIYENSLPKFSFTLAKIRNKTASILSLLPQGGQLMTGIAGYDREYPVSKTTGKTDTDFLDQIGYSDGLSQPAFSTASGSKYSVPNLVAGNYPLVSVSYLTNTGVSAYRFDRAAGTWLDVLEMSPIGLRLSIAAADAAGTNDSRYVGACSWFYSTIYDPYINREEGLAADDASYPIPAIGIEVLGIQGSLVRLRASLTNSTPSEQVLGAHQAAGVHLRIEGNGFFVSAARGGFHGAEFYSTMGDLLPSISGAKIIELRRSFFENSAAPGVRSGEIVINAPSWFTLRYRGWMMNKDSLNSEGGKAEPYVARTPPDVSYMAASPFLACATLATNIVVSSHASYPAAVLAGHPVSYHRFSEANVVSVPNPFTAVNVGTVGIGGNGTPATTNDWCTTSILDLQPGVLGPVSGFSIKIPGGNDTNRIAVPWRPEWNGSGPFTIELWLKGGTAFSCPTASVEFEESQKRGWLVYQGNLNQNSGNGWYFRVYANHINAITAQVDMAINPNAWYHVVGVYTGSTVRLYVNGILVDSMSLSGSYTPNTNTVNPLTFGARHSLNSWPYNGWIDEAAFYTNALTGTQIAAHYTAAATNPAGYATQVLAHNPAGFWRFDDGLNIPKAANFGSGGPSTDGAFLHWSSTVPDLEAPDWPGFETTNRVLQLFGTNGQVAIPPLNLNTNAVTFECLLKRRGSQPNSTAIIMHRNTGDGTGACGLAFRGSYNHLGYSWNDVPSTGTWDSGLTVPDDQWCYVALVVSATQATICLCDGTTWRTATRSAAHALQPFAGFTRIGTDTGASRWFDGQIDEVAIYNAALAPDHLRARALSAFGNTNQPLFTMTPVSQTVELGSPVIFSGSAIGAPTISYQWQRNGEDIEGATNAVFTLTKTDYSDAAQYRVCAANDYAIVLSPPATLVVWPPSSVTNLSYRSATTPGGPSLELIWQQGALYWADDLSGPWNVVNDATPPYYRVSFEPAVEKRFFRLE